MSFSTVLTLILVGGILAVAMATIADWRSARRVEAAVRRANGLDAEPANRPTYVSAEELEAGAPRAIQTDDAFERSLVERLEGSDVTELNLCLAAEQFASHTGARLIVEDAAVLVCLDEVAELRELLPVLRHASASVTTDNAVSQPLVIAAASCTENVLNTLIANRLAGSIDVSVLFGDDAALTKLAEVTASTPVDIKARRSGAADGKVLGRCSWLFADQRKCALTAVSAPAADKE